MKTRHKIAIGIPLTLVVIVLLILIFLNPIVAFSTQKGLDRVAGVSGSFKSVKVTLLNPGYDIYDLKILEMPAKQHEEPLFYAKRIEMRWSWKGILHGHLLRRIEMWEPRVMVPMRASTDANKNPQPAQPPLEIAQTLESAPSAGLERLAVHDGEVILVDEHHDGERLWAHKLELTVENVASRKELMHGLPVLVTAHGKLQKTGDVTIYLTVDPFDKGLTFAGSAEVRHLALSDLTQFTTIEGLKIPKGTIEVYASLTCKRGIITGGIKPIAENVKIEAADKGLGDRIKALFADLAVKILSDRVPGRNAVATLIPIHGALKQPQVQIVPAIMAVLRNAFVEGLSASLSETPPPEAGERQGVLAQAAHALTKDNPKPIQAQPVKK
jgi:hypothetical protein